jgi:hypothetical protein
MLHHILKLTIPALILLSIIAFTSSQADETNETPDDTARHSHSDEAPHEVSPFYQIFQIFIHFFCLINYSFQYL